MLKRPRDIQWNRPKSTREPEENFFKRRRIKTADRINCPSQFVLDSIPLHTDRKHPAEFLFGSPLCESIDFERSTHSDTLKLIAGSMSQRKGYDVFDGKITERRAISLSILDNLDADEFYRGQLANQLFQTLFKPKRGNCESLHDALALPSLWKVAIVQQEALSCGLPILVTPNTGGEDFVEVGDRTTCPDSVT